MNTEVIPAGDSAGLARALQVLAGGGLVAFPTDTVYGVGALAFMEEAVLKLYQVKERDRGKAIPVLIAAADDLASVAREASPEAERLAAAFWPGPLTLVVWRRAELPEVVSPGPTVGVRVPDLDLTLALLSAAGPLATTSANRSGEASPSTADQVIDALGGRIKLVLDGGSTPGGRASTVVDCTQAPPRILRAGPIEGDAILAALD